MPEGWSDEDLPEDETHSEIKPADEEDSDGEGEE